MKQPMQETAEGTVSDCAVTVCPRAAVPSEDVDLLRKIHRILKAGKNVEIRRDTSGRPKVYKVFKEIEP